MEKKELRKEMEERRAVEDGTEVVGSTLIVTILSIVAPHSDYSVFP